LSGQGRASVVPRRPAFIMKKVLVIAYLYPPIFNSGTRRSLEFVNHLPDHGWEPTVLTVDNPDPAYCDPTLLAEVRAGTRIERAPLWSEHAGRKLGRWLARWANPARVAAAVQWRIHRFWNVPDTTACWAPMAVARALALHAEHKFDAIYATGWPWTSFLIAEKISRRTGVPFVVDYRDLWKPADVAWDQATWLQRRINPLLERRVLRRAAGVIATTRTFLTLLPQDVLPEKRFAITNGFGEGDFAQAPPPPATPDGLVRVVYTGVWRPGYGPDDLYLAVKQLKQRQCPHLSRLRIVVAGFAPGPAKEHDIAEFVEEHGRVTHAEALALMSSASALYLPVSKGLYEYASIPGKLFEYLASGRPVLASALAHSEVAGALNHVGGALRLEPGDVDGLAGVLEQLCSGDAGNLFSPRQPDNLNSYKRANLTGQLSQALNSVALGRQGSSLAPELKQEGTTP
jgi:glycosyltransferase involved in cell wall biosynthesis